MPMMLTSADMKVVSNPLLLSCLVLLAAPHGWCYIPSLYSVTINGELWPCHEWSCYFFENKDPMSCDDAHQRCLDKGGYLVSVQSQGENDYLYGKIKDLALEGTTDGIQLYCLGLKNKNWRHNNEPLDYDNDIKQWTQGKCGVVRRTDGVWMYMWCAKKLGWICERPRMA